MKFHIEFASESDFDGVFALGLRLREGSQRYAAQEVDKQHSKRSYLALLEQSHTHGLLAKDDAGTVRGYLFGCIVPQFWSMERMGCVVLLGGEAGAGDVLVQAFEELAQEAGCTEIQISIGYGERLKVYERGFKRKGYRVTGALFLKEVLNG